MSPVRYCDRGAVDHGAVDIGAVDRGAVDRGAVDCGGNYNPIYTPPGLRDGRPEPPSHLREPTHTVSMRDRSPADEDEDMRIMDMFEDYDIVWPRDG